MAVGAGITGFRMEQVRDRPLADAPFTLRSPHMAVDEFLPRALAEEMRAAVDAHFEEPHGHRPETHQVWNYWYVPDLYTYLRTQPEKVIPHPLVKRFHDALSLWSLQTLGMTGVTWPNLSLYVDGCQQGLHNDSTNGRFGFVYSLTWDDRKTIGGETIVLREGDLFRSNMSNSAAGWGIYDLIPPRFNRLAIFDDRMPHGVQRVEGAMDPLEGRFVLHGHIREGGLAVDGPLPAEAATSALDEALRDYVAALPAGGEQLHGPFVLRIAVSPSGEVLSVRPLVDRLARPDGGATEEFVADVLARVSAMRFPAAAGPSQINAPLMFGGPLPEQG
jgi:hypothetical protein